MKKSFITVAILAAGFLTSAIVTSCNGKKGEQQEQKEAEDHNHEEGEEHDHDVVYACSMHPEVTGKEGDKCSKCGMKLEAVKNSDSTEHKHEH